MKLKRCSNPKCNKILTVEDFPYLYKCFGELCKECKLKANFISFKQKYKKDLK